MSRPAPSFPTFDEWQTLSESEQDALLDTLEKEKSRGTLMKRLAIGATCLAACAAVGAVMLTVLR